MQSSIFFTKINERMEPNFQDEHSLFREVSSFDQEFDEKKFHMIQMTSNLDLRACGRSLED